MLLGDSNVGKSSILMRFVDDSFEDNLLGTTGLDYKQTFLTFDTKIIQI